MKETLETIGGALLVVLIMWGLVSAGLFAWAFLVFLVLLIGGAIWVNRARDKADARERKKHDTRNPFK